MKYKIIAILTVVLASCQAQKSKNMAQDEHLKSALISIDLPEDIRPIKKSEEEWKSLLSDMEYYVLREKGTERAFTGPFWDNKKEGIYTCGACELPLFDSHTKFRSGTGWPSFWQPIRDYYIQEDIDYDIGYKRTEVLCARCGGHLGHVFEDGPKPTGLRYCLNGAALDFVERSSELSPK